MMEKEDIFAVEEGIFLLINIHIFPINPVRQGTHKMVEMICYEKHLSLMV